MPSTPPRNSRIWNCLGLLTALSFRLLPRRHRFAKAVLIARVLQPLIRRTRTYRLRDRLGTDSLRETSLDLVLMMLTRHGTEFDPEVRFSGPDIFGGDAQTPTVMVGPHTMLSMLVHRYADDFGARPVVFASDEMMRVSGTLRRAEVIVPGPGSLMRAHWQLRQKRMMMAVIDRQAGDPDTVVLHTSRRDWTVTPGLIYLALRHKARILFFRTYLDDAWTVNADVAELPMTSDPETAIRAFTQFLEGLDR